MTQELRERVAALLNVNCFEGCEPGADEMRACVHPPCRCRTIADAAIALVLEEAAKVCELSADDACYDYEDAALRQAAAAIRALKEGER